VIALVTVQNTRSLRRVVPLSSGLVSEQLQAVLEDVEPDAAKTGALGSARIVEAVAERLRAHPVPLVVDPVLLSKQGAVLTSDAARRALERHLLPLALLVTPNLPEAEALSGRRIRGLAGRRDAARAIADRGPRAVLVKGGHATGAAVDILYWQGEFFELSAPRLDSPHTHGVGCSLSAAITAELAKGTLLVEAVDRAKRWIGRAIATSPGVGKGICAINHLAPAKG